jgi:glutaredoxin 3
MFTVYSKPACAYCEQSKALLESKGLPFEVVNLDVGQLKVEGHTYISRDDLLAKVPGARTMPQIMKDGELVGGFTELKKLLG